MQLPAQASAEDPDNTTDAQGSPFPFLYNWTGLGPAGLSLSGSALAALYTPAALQFGQISFPAGSLQVLILPGHGLTHFGQALGFMLPQQLSFPAGSWQVRQRPAPIQGVYRG